MIQSREKIVTGIAEGKPVLALTTNNPSMMKSFQILFQAEFPWVLV